MKSGEGGIPFRVAAGLDRMVQASRVVSDLEFLLRFIANPDPTPSRRGRPETR
jgi:hypothetical protein